MQFFFFFLNWAEQEFFDIMKHEEWLKKVRCNNEGCTKIPRNKGYIAMKVAQKFPEKGCTGRFPTMKAG